MILKSKTRKRLKNAFRRSSALFMALILLVEITLPTQMFALTGGPSQPEVQSFEPVGTSDMVDLSTGDFNYNIPLLDVEGYPINIAYHSGITMDQEASWVGLGWNINPGVINRNMRGLPDDFAGENVVKVTSMKANKTWGVAADLGLELFGLDNDLVGGGVGGSFGFKFNNYTGPSIEQGISINISVGKEGTGSLNGGLGITSSSDEGLSIQPSAGFSATLAKTDHTQTSLGVNVGCAFNSRAGLKQLTINASVSQSINSDKATAKKAVDYKGDAKKIRGSASISQGAGATFDFGTPTYTPMITNSMKNFAMSGSFTLGGEIWGLDAKIGVSGSYSSQKLAQNTVTNPAYGYLYSEKGQANDNALMDFNREKDGSFTENTACLPIANYTFDTYSVSGQGVGGSYRPFRSNIGYVFDPAAHTTNDDDAMTAELGLGGYVHVGTNVTVVDVSGQSGKWKNGNAALGKLRFLPKGKGNDFENVYFKEANEKSVDDDTAFYAAAGYDAPIRPDINFSNRYEPTLHGFGPVKRAKREKRTKNFSFLKKSEYSDFAVQPSPDVYTSAQGHHIAEVTTLGNDGSRYVYGIAAYNTIQKEVTFSVGSNEITNPVTSGNVNGNNGLIRYVHGTDNSTGNLLGVDNYYSKTTTPAYGHSYLLTSVLSADYVDADAVRGPSDNDLGNYTRFVYDKISNYKWRTPFEADSASYSEGLKSDLQDDKASYIYGEKELWYLDSVITKNYVALFHTSNRIDAAGVAGENGGLGSGRMKRLDSISLYSKHDLEANPSTARPIKRVHFEYSYDLCVGIGNDSTGAYTNGKLTLKKIYFSYQNSNKARLSPYIFDYHEDVPAENPNYNMKSYDRWGNYKPNKALFTGADTNTALYIDDSLATSDYPYVIQDGRTNTYAAVWSLKEIQLPSGGKIGLTYESDDYAYVQNKQAGQMFKIIDYGDSSPADETGTFIPFHDNFGKFYFKLHEGETDISKYVSGLTYVYFRFLVKMRAVPTYNHIEYVSGYGELDSYGVEGGYGWIRMKDVNLAKSGSPEWVNPIVKTAIQFGRLYMPKKVWTADASGITSMGNSSSLGAQILDALVNSDFTKNIKDAIDGPNSALFNNYNVAKEFGAGKSWLRLVNPTKNKKGGGLRVKKIEMTDEWASMTENFSPTSNYGQEYSYALDDGTSSGVASYEPQLGGDENPWRIPLFNSAEKLLVPDDEFYQEEPMGESFFPSPSVGYSKVTVTNLQREDVSRHATGKVVHEFYTSKDFPTITKRTAVNYDRAKDDPFSIASLLKINVRDYFTAAQGFSVEINDMHGKPKSQKVYQEEQTTPISSVEYKYKSEPYLNGSFKLTNKCATIEKDGTVSLKTIGEFFDMVADFREDKTSTNSVVTAINLDVLPIMGIPVVIPMIWPSFAKQKTRFRSATSTKVIQRFGILEETVAQDLGSIVATKNLAYDSETGEVLLTQTSTNFNDLVYNFKYPAWWYYDLMGPAYKNIDFEMNSTSFNSFGVATVGVTAAAYFNEGDEVALVVPFGSSSPNKRGWVDSVASNAIRVIDKFGVPVTGSYSFKVIRSGNRNTTSVEMATITTLSNPLPSLKSNAYQNVLQAGAIEFSNLRKAHCDCLMGSGSTLPYTNNPYVSGAKGNWRPLKSYTHLTGRKQSNYDGNTNIRKDGIFTSYYPYYKWRSGKWEMSPKDWTYVSEVTEFNVYSEELENKDALGRYSSATFGYNQAMALSVAANSQYREQGFDGFEDYNFNLCADDHFKWASVTPTTNDAHTGRYSLRVASGTPKTLTRQIAEVCVDLTGCQLSIDTTIVDATTIDAEPDNGTAPYSYEWEIITGTPTVSLITTGVEFVGTGYRLELRVTDKKGCIQTQIISK